jgi:hypothetical protein
VIDIITDGLVGAQRLTIEPHDEGRYPILIVPVDAVDVLHRGGTILKDAVSEHLASTDPQVQLLAEVVHTALSRDDHSVSVGLTPDDARALAAVLVHYADDAERWGRR